MFLRQEQSTTACIGSWSFACFFIHFWGDLLKKRGVATQFLKLEFCNTPKRDIVLFDCLVNHIFMNTKVKSLSFSVIVSSANTADGLSTEDADAEPDDLIEIDLPVESLK